MSLITLKDKDGFNIEDYVEMYDFISTVCYQFDPNNYHKILKDIKWIVERKGPNAYYYPEIISNEDFKRAHEVIGILISIINKPTIRHIGYMMKTMPDSTLIPIDIKEFNHEFFTYLQNEGTINRGNKLPQLLQEYSNIEPVTFTKKLCIHKDVYKYLYVFINNNNSNIQKIKYLNCTLLGRALDEALIKITNNPDLEKRLPTMHHNEINEEFWLNYKLNYKDELPVLCRIIRNKEKKER